MLSKSFRVLGISLTASRGLAQSKQARYSRHDEHSATGYSPIRPIEKPPKKHNQQPPWRLLPPTPVIAADNSREKLRRQDGQRDVVSEYRVKKRLICLEVFELYGRRYSSSSGKTRISLRLD